MFKLDVNIDKDSVYKAIRHNITQTSKNLKEYKTKTFWVNIDNNKYNIRYDINKDDSINLYVLLPDISDDELIIPNLVLDLSGLLLPESMSIDDIEHTSIKEPVYKPYKELGSSDLPENILKKILSHIKEKGLLNLIKNQSF